MRKLLLICSILVSGLLFVLSSQAVKFNLDTAHSRVGFKVSHLMLSNVTGQFDTFTGSFDFDEKTNTLKDILTEIDVKSINTNQAQRDTHLRSPDFFNAEKFPKMVFKSTKVEMKDKKPVKVIGDLTMAGVTKPVTLNVVYKGIIVDFMGIKRLVFEASTKINRLDWGIIWNKTLDQGGVAVGNEVSISIEGEAVLDK